jgi:hypothetical protein
MANLVTFTRQNGDIEYTEFSYFINNDLTEEDYINEVYFGCDDLTEIKGKYKDTLSTKAAYWFGDELVSVHKVDVITQEELDTLKKYWVV